MRITKLIPILALSVCSFILPSFAVSKGPDAQFCALAKKIVTGCAKKNKERSKENQFPEWSKNDDTECPKAIGAVAVSNLPKVKEALAAAKACEKLACEKSLPCLLEAIKSTLPADASEKKPTDAAPSDPTPAAPAPAPVAK